MFKSLATLSAPILLATCLTGSLATAAPTATGSSLQRRFDNTCSYKIGLLTNAFNVNVANGDPNMDGCVGGYLDNFHGRCGAITDWGCNHVDDSGDITLTFATSQFCSGDDISAAIAAGSDGRVAGLPYKWAGC